MVGVALGEVFSLQPLAVGEEAWVECALGLRAGFEVRSGKSEGLEEPAAHCSGVGAAAEADAARFAEEEAVVRAEQEAAAEKLAEKAAHMRLAPAEPGQKVRASTSFDGVSRPRRGSREIPVAPPAQASRPRRGSREIPVGSRSLGH